MATVQSLAERFDETIQEYMAAVDDTLHPTRALDEEMVRKAVFLVRRGAVQILSFQEDRLLLEAVVSDAHAAKVVLNFQAKTAVCACPQDEQCRHRLAVIFYLYQKVGSLSEWVAAWRSKEQQTVALSDKRSPQQWEALIKYIWRDPVPSYTARNYFYFEQLTDGRIKNAMAHMPLEREWKNLFKTYVHFLSLSEAWDTFYEGTEDVHHSFFQKWFDEEWHELADLLNQLRVQHRTFESDAFFEFLRDRVHSFILADDQSFSLRFSVYRLFWTTLFTNDALRRAERATFHEIDQRIEVFFSILLGEDVTIAPIAVHEVADYIELATLADREQLNQPLQAILHAIKPHVKTFLFDKLQLQHRYGYVKDLSYLFSLIDLDEDGWEDLFHQFGHFGLPAYSMYLIEKKLYKQWAELHHLYRSPLYFAEECGLSQVQTDAPEYVLPLYHRYAMEHLTERNRASYKQAVRIWKKMKAVCKRSGQMAFWQSYLTEIRTQNKRLRALHEEMEKGKIL